MLKRRDHLQGGQDERNGNNGTENVTSEIVNLFYERGGNFINT